MRNVLVVVKYLPFYRLALFQELSSMIDPFYTIIGDLKSREGIKPIPYNEVEGFNFKKSKSIFYYKSLQLWQTGIITRVLGNKYEVFILDGAISHISTWIFAIIGRITGKKIIFWSHGFKGVDTGIKKKIRTFFLKKLPHGLILYGDFSKNVMVAEGFNAERIFVIGNSLDYNAQKKLRDSLLKKEFEIQTLKKSLFANHFKTLIFIGRLMPNKKIDKILDSLYNLEKKGVFLNCIIIGDGPDKSRLANMIKEYNLEDKVYFAGALYKEAEIAKLFLISDLMVSPGNVGLNCIHALAYGVPVITHDNFKYQNPEVESIAPDKNGLLYSYNDYVDMTNKIRLWFTEERNEVFYECLKPIEEKFNPIQHALNINNAIKQIVNK